MFGGCRVFFRSRIKIVVDNPLGKIEGPAIVLCNHGAFVDFFYAGEALRKNRPHFMTARLYFFRRDLGWLLRSLGSFPKSMFSPDFENAKNCRRVLRAGGVLALMPEARLSTVGEFEDIQPDTYRFVHKAGVDVYICHFCGDYLASPKWGDGIRRGARIEAKVFRLATAEELKAWTEEETISRVNEALSYNEFEWLKSRPELTYRKKTLAEGLENILTVCPKCKGKHTISTKKNKVFCEKCGYLTSLDNRYQFDDDFVFSDLTKWFDWRKSLLEEEIFTKS
jgi:1-acyl-sn-glycerol-3-phosphate acyltransferase